MTTTTTSSFDPIKTRKRERCCLIIIIMLSSLLHQFWGIFSIRVRRFPFSYHHTITIRRVERDWTGNQRKKLLQLWDLLKQTVSHYWDCYLRVYMWDTEFSVFCEMNTHNKKLFIEKLSWPSYKSLNFKFKTTIIICLCIVLWGGVPTFSMMVGYNFHI